MLLEVINTHPRAKEFINLIDEFYHGLICHENERNTLMILERENVISFFSSCGHEAVLKLKIQGEILSFPLEMFGAIWEM